MRRHKDAPRADKKPNRHRNFELKNVETTSRSINLNYQFCTSNEKHEMTEDDII